MPKQRLTDNEVLIGLVSVSDRASQGVYQDEGLPALKEWLSDAILTPVRFIERLIPDEQFTIESTLRELVDQENCDLVLTTGGTGPSRRDVTPEATLAVATREMPGFAEQMRRISLNFVPTAILSRQVAVLREIPGHAALIVNLPGRPKSIAETLGGYRADDGKVIDAGIFAAIPYCIDLIGGPYIDTDPSITEAFRPKNARKTVPHTREPEMPPLSDAPSQHVAAQNLTASEPLTAPQAMPSESGFESFSAEKLTPHFPEPQASPQPVPASASGRLQMSADAIARRSVHRGVPLHGAASRVVPLEVTVREPLDGKDPQCTVIWLHGLGCSGEDFAGLQTEFSKAGAPSSRFILPNAPKIAIRAHQGIEMPAWYNLYNDTFTSPEDLDGIRSMHLRVTQIINEIISTGTPCEKIFLGGFSQGAAMALYSGLRQARTLGGVIALSGYLPLIQHLDHDITPAGRGTPFFMAHGAFDSVINPMIAQKSADVIDKYIDTLVWREYDMDHELCASEISDIATFMRAALQS